MKSTLLMRVLRGAVVVWLLGVSHLAQAVVVDHLYEGSARVTDNSDAARQKGFVDALSQVLAKLSGRRDAAIKVGASAKDVARYVQRYSYVAGGRIEVGFDAAAINALLDQAGLPVWGRERPLVVVVYPVALQGMREARATTELLAKQRGVPMTWASENSDALPVNALQQIRTLGQRYNAEAVVLARGTTAANLNWQMVFNGASQESTGSAEEGPQLAAEVLSHYYAVNGKESVAVTLDVAGITSVEAYGTTLNFLGRQLLVRNVALTSLDKDVARFKLELRGSSQAFERVLLLDKTLVQVGDGGPQNATLRYRYARESAN